MPVFESKLLASLEAGEGDVTVSTQDGVQMRAESSILKICSPVLRAELTGSMIEATTLCITMDCESSAAKSFLRFLYLGRLTEDDFKDMDLLLALVRMADFYGVIGELVSALDKAEPYSLFEGLLDASIGPLEEPSSYISDLLIKLRPAILVETTIARPVLRRLKLDFGSNVYRYLCHAFALDLPEVREACQHSMSRVHLELSKGVSQLESEVNEAVICDVIATYPTQATVALEAFLEFLSLCSQISFDHSNTRPAIGDSVVLMDGIQDGASGRMVQDDHSQRPFQVITNGETRWFSEEQVKLVRPIPFFERVSSLIPMVQGLVAKAQRGTLMLACAKDS